MAALIPARCMAPDAARLRGFWNGLNTDFTHSESGWFDAGEVLSDRMDARKRQALLAAIAATGLTPDRHSSVLDAGAASGTSRVSTVPPIRPARMSVLRFPKGRSPVCSEIFPPPSSAWRIAPCGTISRSQPR